MTKMDIMIIADYSQASYLSAHELCERCACPMETLESFVMADILNPIAETDQGVWLFDVGVLGQLKVALRLQHDFDLTLSGLALVMDLLAERNALIERNTLLERHLFGDMR